MLLSDFYFSRHPQDISWREFQSRRAAHALVAAADPALFDMKAFTELGTPRDMSKIFESAELITWKVFRDSEDSRYVSLVLPRYAADYRTGQNLSLLNHFHLKRMSMVDHSKYL